MKRFLFIIFIAILSLGLFGCKKDENNDKQDPDDKYIKDTSIDESNVYQKEWKDYIDSEIPKVYDKRHEFVYEYTFADGQYATVTWESSNTKSITNRGGYLKNIIDDYIRITTHVEMENGQSFSYFVTTMAPGEYTPEAYAKRVGELYLPDEIFKDYEFITVEDKIFKDRGVQGVISYQSADETLLTNNGEYKNTSSSDMPVIINYTIVISGITVTGKKVVTIKARDDQSKVNAGIEWLENNFSGNNEVMGNLSLPETDDKGLVVFEWESNNKDFIDNEGKIRDFKLNKTFSFSVVVRMNDTKSTKEYSFKTIGEDKAVEYLLNRMHFDVVNQSYFLTYVVYPNHENEDYGFLNFFVRDLDETTWVLREPSDRNYTMGDKTNNAGASRTIVNLGMASITKTVKRPLEIASSMEFVVVHDTGDNKFTAAQWANEVQTSERECSWHFTVDDHDIYQQIPIDECAWHAGDWPTKANFIDTGVKYTVNDPTMEFKDGYLYINGIKSNCSTPVFEGVAKTEITPAGLYSYAGSNGNYFIDTYHYNNTYKVVANDGGNKNGIGIETCINNGVKYSQVMRTTANLVAHLLAHYNLDTSRALYHRSFSGKLCPQSMIRAKDGTQFTLDVFEELVNVEYFILTQMPGLKLSYTSNNPDILDNEGRILKYVTEATKVSYTVSAEFNGVKSNFTFETTINPK